MLGAAGDVIDPLPKRVRVTPQPLVVTFGAAPGVVLQHDGIAVTITEVPHG